MDELPNSGQKVSGWEDTTPIPFGKYRGKQLQEVPADYLFFIYDYSWVKDNYPALIVYIDKNRKLLEQEYLEAHPDEEEGI